MPKKNKFLARHQELLQLSGAIAFLVLTGVYASLTGASGAGLSTSAVWLLIVAAAVGALMAG